jgi:hypothetical protein
LKIEDWSLALWSTKFVLAQGEMGSRVKTRRS